MTSVPAHESTPLGAVTERRFPFAWPRGQEEAYSTKSSRWITKSFKLADFMDSPLATDLGQMTKMS